MVGHDLRVSCSNQGIPPDNSDDWIKDIKIKCSKIVQLILFITILRMILENHGVDASPLRIKETGSLDVIQWNMKFENSTNESTKNVSSTSVIRFEEGSGNNFADIPVFIRADKFQEDLSRSKRGKRLRVGEYGNHESLHISTETPEKLEIKSDKETPSDHAVDVSIPNVANFVLRGQYGITIASMTILAVFVVERFFTLSMCLAKRQIPQQDRPRPEIIHPTEFPMNVVNQVPVVVPNAVPVVVPGQIQNLADEGLRNRNRPVHFNPFLDHLPPIENIGAIQNV